MSDVELPKRPDPLIQYRATFGTITGYTADQMAYYGQQCYAAGVQAALEAAAVKCAEQRPDAKNMDDLDHARTIGCQDCAAAIRAMKPSRASDTRQSPISDSAV